MTSLLRFSAALIALSLTLGGCTKVGTSSTTETTATNGTTAQSGGNPWTHHGVLRMANLSEPDSLNPVVGNQQIDSDLAMFWGGFLFNWSDQSKFVPELATELPTLANKGISADGKTITYHLRQGVLWHDGQPFTSDDVIFTYHAIMSKANNVPSTVGYDLIAAIDKLDDHTVRVHLKQSYAPFVATFFNQSGTPYPVLPAHILAKLPNINRADFNSRPVGTGPFIMDHWQRGSQIVFKANPKYWRGPPKLNEIQYNPVPSENTILTQLKSHDIDFEYNVSSANYELVKDIPGTVTTLTPFTQYGQLGINTSSANLSDVRVRQALWYALNVGEMIQRVTHGVNVPGHTDQPEFLWAYNPKTPQYSFDPAKARQLLDAAGWVPGKDGIRTKNGARLALTMAGVSGSATGSQVSVLAQRYFHDVGVDLEIKNYISSLFFASFGAGGIIQTGKFDLAFYSWLNGTDPDDSTLWMCDQFPPHGQNVYRFCNHDLDAAEKIALTNNDQAARKKAYDKIQDILAENVPAIIVWYNRRVAVANTDFKNFKPAHAVTSFWNSWEWEI
ncbi:MAG: peptide ABC transporter substrate-binding protein [Candidatus Eremiobacteraeota bacterium]|nr:peptide ABC transporter substrate-binding protein [Candidatus Eremiobacteraeota bacterium]